MPSLAFLPGVPVDHVMARLASAAGKELESGKLNSPESSAALAVNTFGWFVTRPHLLPPFPGSETALWAPTKVDVEYCARFPWSGGRHPWLDAVVEMETQLIGVESKRFEPFRDKKSVSLSDAYDRPMWGERMQPFERVRDRLRTGEMSFVHLDAVQLVKHSFGLVTDARRKGKAPHLHYLFAEPAARNARMIKPAVLAKHRQEIDEFNQTIQGAEVTFSACSYRDWISSWSDCAAEVAAHGQRVLEVFAP